MSARQRKSKHRPDLMRWRQAKISSVSAGKRQQLSHLTTGYLSAGPDDYAPAQGVKLAPGSSSLRKQVRVQIHNLQLAPEVGGQVEALAAAPMIHKVTAAQVGKGIADLGRPRSAL